MGRTAIKLASTRSRISAVSSTSLAGSTGCSRSVSLLTTYVYLSSQYSPYSQLSSSHTCCAIYETYRRRNSQR